MGIGIKLLGGYLLHDKPGLSDYELRFRSNKYLLTGVLNYACALGPNPENLATSLWNGLLLSISCRVPHTVYQRLHILSNHPFKTQ